MAATETHHATQRKREWEERLDPLRCPDPTQDLDCQAQMHTVVTYNVLGRGVMSFMLNFGFLSYVLPSD